MSTTLPRLSSEIQSAFWGLLLNRGRARASGARADQLDAAVDAARREIGAMRTHEGLESMIEKAGNDPASKQAMREAAAIKITSPEARRETEHRLEPLVSLLEPNPRAMKLLVNAFGFRQAIQYLSGRPVSEGALARWTIVELRWPLLADLLAVHPEYLSAIEKKEAPTEVPENLKALFSNETVKSVLSGKVSDSLRPLTEADIRAIA